MGFLRSILETTTRIVVRAMRVTDDVDEATGRLVDLLSASSPNTPVRGLAWSSAELATHLLTIPLRLQRMVHNPEPFPASIGQLNAAELAELGIHQPRDVALALPAAIQSLVSDLGNEEEREVPFFGMQHTVEGVLGVLLCELLVHGLDLARTIGEPWTITTEQATLALCGVLPAAVHSVDKETVGRMDGSVVHIRLRRETDWTLSIASGDVAIRRGEPERADLRVSVDPATQLLLGYGRTSRLRAALTGKVVAYGRKPWLVPLMSRLFVET